MHFRLQMVIERADGVIVGTDELACLERTGLAPAKPGLTLEEAKSLLATCQKRMILAQAEDYEAMDRPCPACGVPRPVKAASGIVLRTLFGSSIIPKSIPDKGDAKCFAMVHTLDTRPQRRLGAVLDAQGLTQRQSIRFVSDVGDTVHNLQLRLHSEGEHWLDWFQITMCITVMRQMARSITSSDTPDLADRIDRDLARIKWLLWHGNHIDGAEAADLITWDVELVDNNKDITTKLENALGEFSVYIRRNADFIANYGDKWRNGERISSGFAESAVNQVLSRRMVKKQQMRWTKAGAHLLLQTRTQTLNCDLRKCFQRWYPDIKSAA